MRGLVQECKNAQLLTIKKLGYADYGLADSNNYKSLYSIRLNCKFKRTGSNERGVTASTL